MEITPLTVIDVRQETMHINGYKNFPVSLTNDHVIRVSIMTAPYHWHYHPNSDETFLVTEGILEIELNDQTVQLHPGQLFTIPANTRHCTRPVGKRSVNLTFERADIITSDDLQQTS